MSTTSFDRIHLRQHQYWGWDISWCNRFLTRGLCARNIEGIAPEDRLKICKQCLKTYLPVADVAERAALTAQ